tara:strand:+ start:511 stop:918 length:408 start_codon:yes stop_codon:yes gene_type:complete
VIKALRGNALKSLALLRSMDEMRFMFGMMTTMLGYDPKLADILTDENRKHISLAKNSIYFCSDPDPLDPENEIEYMAHALLSGAEDWSKDYIRGMMTGLLMSLDTEQMDEFETWAEEGGELYRLLQSMLIERVAE